ncbi:hypothetical protein HDU87_007607 [Geranomyces variabilis]|uniref:Uncharacterized protein n=1 Tax=Geranomyces variabilis TaxID=109894 RepID=A0AAD5TDZ6_9FUNG|nr:hypothetical protein HDU87_007607 [Geranomyces variabilis]
MPAASPRINPTVKLIVLTAGGLYAGYAIHQVSQSRAEQDVLVRAASLKQQHSDENILAKWEAERAGKAQVPQQQQ